MSLLDEITIRELSFLDFDRAELFQQLINEVIEENAEITLNRYKTLREEQAFLSAELSLIQKGLAVYLVAEHGSRPVGVCSVELGMEKKNHVAEIGIIIKQGYRGIGLGAKLMKETMKLAQERLKPKMFRLSVFATNERAIKLYNRLGFKEVARVPGQFAHNNRFVDEIIMIKWLSEQEDSEGGDA